MDISFYDDLKLRELQVPCSSWEESVALRCWGPEYKEKVETGFIERITIDRKTGLPQFQVKFPNKKYEKQFNRLGLDYIMKYCDDVPIKYLSMRSTAVSALEDEAQEEVLINHELMSHLVRESEKEDVEPVDFDATTETQKCKPNPPFPPKNQHLLPAKKMSNAQN